MSQEEGERERCLIWVKLNKIEKEDNLGDVGGEQSVKRMFKEEGLANVREKRIVLSELPKGSEGMV